MKKITILALALALMLTFVSCTQSEEPDVRGDYSTDDSTFVGTPSELETNEIPATPSELPAESETATKEFSLGVANANVYENSFIGIGFKADEGWTFYDDAQIKELNGMALDMAGEDYANMIENATVVYDMFAASADNLNNVSVNLEKASAADLAAFDAKATLEQVAVVSIPALENVGYSDITYEISTATIDGKTLDVLNISANIMGYPMSQTAFMVKCDGYVASASITAMGGSDVANILDNFYWL